jgi:hypothetical protein
MDAVRAFPVPAVRGLLLTSRLRPEVLLVWLLGAHVVLKILIYPMVMHAAPLGDESAYLNGGRALSNVLRDLASFTTPDGAEVKRNVVASGWFMPGMSVLVAPLYLVVPDAPTWLARGYLGVATLIVFVAVVRYVAKRLGPSWACVLVVVPGLIPSWVVFSFGAWGDLCAGLVLVILVVHLIEIVRGLRRGQPPTLKAGVLLGLIAITSLYLRSSTVPLLVGLGVLCTILTLTMLAGRDRRRAVVALAGAAAAFLLLLAPWSLLASHTLGGRVITTTTMPTVLANTFGDRHELCFGPCDPDSTLWFRPLRYAREVGRATDTSEVVVLKQMSDHALRAVGPHRYLRQVDRDFDAYLTQPNTFTSYLAPPGGRGAVGRLGQTVASWATWALYAPLLLLGLISMFFVARSSTEARVLDLMLKLSIGALLAQPFVHVSGGRYWTTAGPVLALAGFALLRERRAALAHSPGSSPDPGTHDPGLDRWLGRAQVAAALAAASVTAVLLVVKWS